MFTSSKYCAMARNISKIKNSIKILNCPLHPTILFRNFGTQNVGRISNVHLARNYATKLLPKQASSLPAFSKADEQEFIKYFPELVKDLTNDENFWDIDIMLKRLVNVLEYNVPNGKKVRGLSTVISYKLLESPENLTVENIRLANLLGWCAELLGAAILIVDDIIDNSETRRNRTCWFRVEGVGMLAICDSILLETGLFFILKKHFSNHPHYADLMQVFYDTHFKTSLGQILDTTKPTVEEITNIRFDAVAKYKTGYYTFVFPVRLAMFLANAYDPKVFAAAEEVLLKMGHFYQTMNDIWDCWADPKLTGKVGTDIEEGKCTWLSMNAVQRANRIQYESMLEHYGKDDRKSVEIIRNIYEELNLYQKFKEYRENHIFETNYLIQRVPSKQMQEVLSTLTKKMYDQKVDNL